MDNLDKAIEIADKLKKDTERIYMEMDANITELIRIFKEMGEKLENPIDPKDPEELDRFNYPNGFISSAEQQTQEKGYPYK